MNREKFEAYLALARSTVYSEPEEGNSHNALIKQAVDAFIPMFDLPSDAYVLDLGCGPGVFMDEMRARGQKNVWGVTLSPEDVAACRAKGHGCTLGDVRARGRRPMDSLSRGEMMRQMFEASDDGFVLFSDVVEMFWPGGMQRPSTWRVLVRLAASFCRKRYGMVLEYDRAREGYVWVRL